MNVKCVAMRYLQQVQLRHWPLPSGALELSNFPMRGNGGRTVSISANPELSEECLIIVA